MKRSALHHYHQAANAVWTARHGWQLPASYGDAEQEFARAQSAAVIADFSYLQKFESHEPLPGSWKLNTRRHLIMGEPPLEAGGALDITGVYAVFLLAGPQVRGVLQKLTSLNVSEAAFVNQACKQASLAHAHCIMIRQDLGTLPSFKLLITRDYAESVWESILHAGHELQLSPVGLDALARLTA